MAQKKSTVLVRVGLRVTPAINKLITRAAKLEGRSLNMWLNRVIADAAKQTIASSNQK